MDWFKRYGIPGGYFYGMFLLWFYVFYPCKVEYFVVEDYTPFFLAFGGITFVPVGYLISIFQQILYLTISHGIVTAALKEAKLFTDEIKNVGENLREAESALYVVGKTKKDNKLSSKHIELLRHWVGHRNDILAINGSIIVASLIILILFTILYFSSTVQGAKLGLIFLYLFTIIFIVVCFVSRHLLWKQCVRLISGWYQLVNGSFQSPIDSDDSKDKKALDNSQ